jgi:glycerol-3-phosphate dehydrogenase (NAD(P)+)
MQSKNISIIGAGTIGTALGNILSYKKKYTITLLSIEKDVVDSINNERLNLKYFPMNQLHSKLGATSDPSILQHSDIIFIAIPSFVLIDYLRKLHPNIRSKSILVNLAKGFGEGNKTIVECLKNDFANEVCTLKGPTFAREIINNLPSAFTLGYSDAGIKPLFQDMFDKTSIFFDVSDDLKGVEILSILKNIYAIVLGIVDAHFNSSNLRSLVLTKAFSEMREILLSLGGREQTMFKYCGIGDFTHTALNDLSRNRTLGLLIGKGFFTEHVSHELVLEGKSAVNIIYNQLDINTQQSFPLIRELYNVLNDKYQITNFINKILTSG